MRGVGACQRFGEDHRVRYFEDFQAGIVHELGGRRVTRDEIVAFAREFDPQPFHLDEEAARKTPFGGLIASGWHTAAIVQRLVVDGFVNGSASLGSPGVDELRWLKPVRPGDELRVTFEVTEAIPSRSKPDRGTIKVSYSVSNQKGEVVMTMKAAGLIGRRPGSDTQGGVA
jgi:acyl dehydratase